MAEDQDGTVEQVENGGAKARRILTDIAPHSWEHPADKAALQALRRIPVFDDILRKIFGFMTERAFRLAFQASAVQVSEKQFPKVYQIYKESLKTLDVHEEYPLFISQTPIVNAGAWGMEKPFIILNSGTVRLLERRPTRIRDRARDRSHRQRSRPLQVDDRDPAQPGDNGLPHCRPGGTCDLGCAS